MMLSRTFRSVKHINPNPSKDSKPSSILSTKSQSQLQSSQSSPNSKPKSRSWCVYLILSTNTPIKTYVGVTTDFSRRLKQNNGELKGGAKASRIGRPFFSKNLDHGKGSSSLDALEGLKSASSRKVSSGNYDGYVIGGEVDAGSLPDESDGESSTLIRCENVSSPAVLFLPGFGVGSFHYENQLKDLGRVYRVWAIDFLGQGMSLPFENPAPSSKEGRTMERKDHLLGLGDEAEPWANELVYSMDLWRDRVCYFIEHVIREPVYVVGNSLGGFVAVYFAACNPHLVKGDTLLNANPFWGFLPNPTRSPRLAKIFPWCGTFPLPESVRKLLEVIWQMISNPESTAEVLKQVYADHSTNVDIVFSRILETTQHPAAAASFALIMFAPQGQLSFGEALSRCKMNGVPICLKYGKEDPWEKPVLGLQVKKQLPEAPYYEISPADHCPHDEVPEVVNYLLRGWIKNLRVQGFGCITSA
ncbi:hypothetical protein Dsin_010911 [Dipteronia sinensis]|uniref:Pheophytinase n=1 Tax=Dipteronia sinensis TaxID=43782 RepID=A0AAE0ATC5_9ROSI|nr:hypothetical protein Dsin_010911 [Dipteronia sinensis]